MYNVVCVSASALAEDFLHQIELIAQSKAEMIILREKQLSEEDYFSLAEKVNEICNRYSKRLVIHKYVNVARELGIRYVHLPFADFLNSEELHKDFDVVGTSVHSTEDAVLAENKGADYITAGHIFLTDCKKELEPRGIEFLRDVCEAVKIPVYAIGGINKDTAGYLRKVKNKNFKGVCIMSEFMKTSSPDELIREVTEKMENEKSFEKDMLSLYAITDRHWLDGRELCEVCEEALKGGITMLQYRDKNKSFDELCMEAEKLHALCKAYNVPLIINDNVDVALAVDAEGVHLGQGDMSPIEARKLLGENKIIGVTARSVEQAIKAEKDGADYLGSGAVFGTSTKGDAVKMSLETLHNICSAVNIPVCAIGGITNDNITELYGTRISGVAVVSGIFAAKDITETTKEMKLKICRLLSK